MDTVLFSLFSIAYLVFFLLALHLFQRWRIPSAAILLPIMAGLIYDNGIIAMGRFIGEGHFLENMNAARFWLHAFSRHYSFCSPGSHLNKPLLNGHSSHGFVCLPSF